MRLHFIPSAFVPLALVCIALIAPRAMGEVILQPASASTNMGEFDSMSGEEDWNKAARTVDQSGLQGNPYTSLVTDFDVYTASDPIAVSGFPTYIWSSDAGVRSGNFDFDLGGSYIVSAMAFWNEFGDESAVRQFNLLLDDNASFASPVNLGLFTASNSLGSQYETIVEVFSFPATPASFVRLEILNTWNESSAVTGFNEAAFRVVVPEPGIFGWIALGMIGLAARRARRKAVG